MSLFFLFFFFNDPATTEIYTLSLHDALPISNGDPINPRTIMYWLEGVTLPNAVHLVTLIQMCPLSFLKAFIGWCK